MAAPATFGPARGTARLLNRRPSYRDEPEPQADDDGVLKKIGRSALSGLAVVGNTLDLPGSMVRDVLGGENPFDQWLTPLSSENRVGGRDLLQKAGLLKRNKAGLDFGDVAGFAAEIALDPLTFATFGVSALTKTGKAARAAGTSTRGLKASIQAGERGLAAVGIPFTGKQTVVGTGKLAQSAAGALDALGATVKRSAPVRGIRGLFDPRVQGKFGRFEQEIAEEASRAIPAARAAARTQHGKALDAMEETFSAFEEAFGEDIRTERSAGGLPSSGGYNLGDVVRTGDRGNYGAIEKLTGDTASVFFRNPETGATATKDMPFDQLEKAFAQGTVEADDFARMATRKVYDDIVRFTAESSGDVPRAFATVMGRKQNIPQDISTAIAKRAEQMRNANEAIYSAIETKGGNARWIEGSDEFSHFPRYVDPKIAKDKLSARVLPTSFGSMQARSDEIRHLPAEIVNKIVNDVDARRLDDGADWIQQKYGSYLATPESGYEDVYEHAQALHEWAIRHKKAPLFTKSTLDDFLKYQMGAHRVSRSLDAVHEVFLRNAGQGDIPLPQAYKLAGMNPDTALAHLAEKSGKSVDELSALALPTDVVQAAVGVNKTFDSPEWAQKLGESIDGFLKVFKTSVTVPFPSFLARNFVSGQHVNLSTGMIETATDIADYGAAFKEASRQLKNPSPELLRELEIHGVIGGPGFQDVDVFQGKGILPDNPLKGRSTLKEARMHVAENPLTVDAVPGVQRLRTAFNTVAGTGAKANQNVEWANRVPMYLYLKGKGWTPEAAAAKVEELHFNYADASPFERNVMKRLAPFYSFSRRMGPLTLKTLAEKPGGGMAQTIRATNEGTSDDPSLPEYVASTAAIPLGESEDGTKRFLTGFGFAHEESASWLGGGVQGTLMEGISRTNPLIKAPLEWATGESFFQRGPMGGRELSDMDPTIGRTLANITGQKDAVRFPGSKPLEFIAANSPLARVLTSARQLTDTRKGPGAKAANLLTGMRVSDISPAAQEATLRDQASSLMRESGAKAFQRVYFSKADLEKMSPEEREAAEQFMGFQNKLAQQAKKRKREREFAQ